MKLEATGIDEFAKMLGKLGNEVESIAAQSLYEGAGIMANALKSAIASIPTENWHRVEPGVNPLRSATPAEKRQIQEAVGIAKFDKNGSEVNTAIGITGSGYMKRKTKKYKKGVPIAMVARSINSGSSYRAKYPFVRMARAAAKGPAEAAMVDKAEELIDKITGE